MAPSLVARMKDPVARANTLLCAAYAAIVILMTACMYFVHVGPDDVSKIVSALNLIGAPPETVTVRLERAHLPHGRRISIGSYDAQFQQIQAAVTPINRAPLSDWMVTITIKFDSARRARTVDVATSAVSPL